MEQTLLLNASYEPLKIVDWQKAVTLWCQGKVEIISAYEREIRTVKFSFKLPSVIRLLRYIKIKRRFDYVPFSRANIYARDEHTCQYCGDVFPTSELTFDHVVPVAQGGRKDWEAVLRFADRLRPHRFRRPAAAEQAAGAVDHPADGVEDAVVEQIAVIVEPDERWRFQGGEIAEAEVERQPDRRGDEQGEADQPRRQKEQTFADVAPARIVII